ncbi:carbohydrate-binding module family 48 protein [Wolfiporia cocos MD-104 SS10]|uniref:Carbohydrate-binding module family 48 protein n=1 Tax=Wolfiporia cocos (strain MD-104) TaxID=742152 RepID=A0A2H3JFC4_WOLCO|nr:carbohydrate-binding module family 48 protein [Wolfiporia cocos MD-104 SS10]
MGNTASNPVSQHSPSPVRRAPNSPARASPSPSSRVHRSLRQKRKSLELPDLASLALTPAASPASVSPHGAYRRPRASSPIPIPTSAQPPQPSFRPQNNLPSAAHIALKDRDRDRDENLTANYRPNGRIKASYIASAYPSRSFVQGSPPQVEPLKIDFVPEVVHSTLPLALSKAEEDAGKLEPVSVKIVYRGTGRSVVLARAGDDNWQGRQPMEFDSSTAQWFTYVSLLPGTHHLKFIVDDQWRTSDDYPTAADDRDGSLANYVAVQVPSSAASPATVPLPASSPISPLASPGHAHAPQFNSFWSEGSALAAEAARAEAQWTSEIPAALSAAAAEEEAYLASADNNHDFSSNSSASAAVPVPPIPPAPALPRHLDKLILNARSAGVGGSPVPAERDRSRRSGRSRREKERVRNSALGMTVGEGADGEHATPTPSPLGLPVVTASGTEVAAGSAPPTQERTGAGKLDVSAGLADDASVLPVPSHVVLHHLSTSAIRNGVLAVANTTRYRKKYITTIYYKPT